MAPLTMSVLPLRVLSGIAGVGIVVGFVLPMLPFQDEWELLWPPLAVWVTLTALAFWFAAIGSSQRHRRAMLYSAAAAIGLALIGYLALSTASPVVWPEHPFAAPLFGSMAGAVGFVIGALVGPVTLLMRGS
jgi:hypothetical protein